MFGCSHTPPAPNRNFSASSRWKCDPKQTNKQTSKADARNLPIWPVHCDAHKDVADIVLLPVTLSVVWEGGERKREGGARVYKFERKARNERHVGWNLPAPEGQSTNESGRLVNAFAWRVLVLRDGRGSARVGAAETSLRGRVRAWCVKLVFSFTAVCRIERKDPVAFSVDLLIKDRECPKPPEKLHSALLLLN